MVQNDQMQPVLPDPLAAAVKHLQSQFLHSTGWRRSIEQGAAVDTDGPVPWFTYPAIRFLQRLVRPDWRVLEYGSGNSTRWWAKRVVQVVAVEHDPAWAAALRRDMPANARLVERVMDDLVPPDCDTVLREQYFRSGCFGLPTPDPTRNYRAGLLDGAYLAYGAVGLEYPAGYFDVVVVDGMARALTAWVAARQVAPGGLVVFDNSDRNDYRKGYEVLQDNGFVRIDFWGLGPINPYEWCTSIFVRELYALRRTAP
jgi:hypothetical protein